MNVLNAAKLIQSPQIYAMFLLWMLSELFDTLPDAGDLEKPKFVSFFDEAHPLSNDMPGELLDKIVQVVKLIRSKGIDKIAGQSSAPSAARPRARSRAASSAVAAARKVLTGVGAACLKRRRVAPTFFSAALTRGA